MGDVFPEIRTQQSKIKETLRREEESFNKTLDKGIEEFEAMMRGMKSDASIVAPLGGWPILPGRSVFKLYDTYGFPLDLTELMAIQGWRKRWRRGPIRGRSGTQIRQKGI